VTGNNVAPVTPFPKYLSVSDLCLSLVHWSETLIRPDKTSREHINNAKTRTRTTFYVYDYIVSRPIFESVVRLK
jgi:hypothetical protein